jgi:uncharacterized protein YeaO (DUF488 family)
MPARCKSIYEDTSPADGVRVLTTNYWPRGVSRERAGSYVRALAPTRELLRAYRDGLVAWDEYETRYRSQMCGESQQAEIRRFAALARTETVTVMCVCRDDAHCHRRLLRDLISDEMERAP